MEIPKEQWWGCYDAGWAKDEIVPDAFSHPAKYSRNLIYRIVREGILRGWWKPGDTIVDPFGGVGLGGLAAAAYGLGWLGIELEERFVEIARANFALHRREWEHLGRRLPLIVQGDSRNLREIVRRGVSGVVSSPPYGPTLGDFDGDKPEEVLRAWHENYRKSGGGMSYEAFAEHIGNGRRLGMTRYSADPANIGNLGGISSPPYGNRVDDSGTGPVAEKNGVYGASEGQLGNARISSVTSPPYIHGLGNSAEYTDEDKRQSDEGRDIIQRKSGGRTDYGSTDGQIGRMPAGSITSPPYADGGVRQSIDHHPERMQGGVGGTGDYSGPRLAGSITNPPFSQPDTRDRHPVQDGSVSDFMTRAYTQDRQATTDGNLAALPIGTVTSPPWEKQENALAAHKFKELPQHTTGHSFSPEARQRQMEAAEAQSYGESEGQIGNTEKDTYWGACASIYQQLLDLFPPGGVLALVVKAFVRDRKIVDLPGMTLDLLLSQGWQPIVEIHAMLVAEGSQPGLLEDTATKRKSRKSFFRRLAESKGSPAIDYEVVLVVRKGKA